MQAALGILGWTPDIFWNATLLELNAGLKGWQFANGGGDNLHAMGRDEFEDLKLKMPDPEQKRDS